MAAVIIAAYRRRQRGSCDQNSDVHADDIDDNRDGKVSHDEIRRHLPVLAVRADSMVERLTLERDLGVMLMKLPTFLVCLICFLLALCEFSPPAAMWRVHRNLWSQFSLGEVSNVASLASVYDFMATFEAQNRKMQATSAKYWCESRYANNVWDEKLLVPRWECKSPRQYALGYSNDATAKYSAWAAAGGTPQPSRRRRQGGSHSQAASSSLPACLDQNAVLQREASDPNTTCQAAAPSICDVDSGLAICPRTCGMCSPFEYEQMERFTQYQVAVLPAVVHQTRFAEEDCHDFAHAYETQKYNPLLAVLPPLDGQRLGRILHCLDRDKHYEGEWAFELACPQIAPTSACPSGKMHKTKRHKFHGIPVYPEILLEPKHDIASMKAVNWLDVQTEAVTLSTAIYSEGSEIFTSLLVEFNIDEVGNVVGAVKLISYRDLTGGAKATFIACLIICMVSGLVGVVISSYHLVRHSEDCRWGQKLYELFSRGLFFAYPLVLLVSWSQQKPMANEYSDLLSSFVDLPKLHHDNIEGLLHKYFDVKDHIYAENQWLQRHRLAAYFVCYVQFLQIIYYFDVHPKMGTLTATVFRAMDNIVHFLILFFTLFIMMAFMAHWSLGESIDAFGTFGDAVMNQGRMIYGAFIFAPGAENLHGTSTMFYWLYAIVFMLVMFFTLLNFFLAIIVDSFVEVKGENAKTVVVKGFFPDLCHVVRQRLKARRCSWPHNRQILSFFEGVVEKSGEKKRWLDVLAHQSMTESEGEKQERLPICRPEELAAKFPEFAQEEVLVSFLHHYFLLCKEIFCRQSETGDKKEARKPPFHSAPQMPIVTEALEEASKSRERRSSINSQISTQQKLVPTIPGQPDMEVHEDTRSTIVTSESQKLLDNDRSSYNWQNGMAKTTPWTRPDSEGGSDSGLTDTQSARLRQHERVSASPSPERRTFGARPGSATSDWPVAPPPAPRRSLL